jgi:hypothetical protein
VARLTSFAREGTYEGYDTLSAKVPVDIFANSPNQMTMVVHTQNGDSVTTFDGRNGWIAAADKLMRVLPLDGGDLEGAKMDASLSFPARIKQDFQWRTGFPSVSIDDQPVEVIQNAARGATGAKLYFDSESGLLVRQVRFVDTAVGRHPDADRLFGLPRRRGREGAVQARHHVDGRPIDNRAEPGAAERRDRRGAIRQTRAPEGQERRRGMLDSSRTE